MQLTINALVEQSIRELSKKNESIIRKFLANFFLLTNIKNINKKNLHIMIIYRNFFLAEIEKRFKGGDMQFLTDRVYGYIRHYIKWVIAEYQKHYIIAKKRNITLI
jgi:hypothetical protein